MYASPDEFITKLNSPLLQNVFFYEPTLPPPPPPPLYIINTSSTKSPSPTRKQKKQTKQKRGQNGKTPWYSSECKKLKWFLNRAEKEFRKKMSSSLGKNSNPRPANVYLEINFLLEKNKTVDFWIAVNEMRRWGKNLSGPGEFIPPEWLNYFTSLLSEEISTPEFL